jgi:hypothetical protein
MLLKSKTFAILVTSSMSLLATTASGKNLRAHGRDAHGTFWYAIAKDGVHFVGEGGCNEQYKSCTNPLTGTFIAKEGDKIKVNWDSFGEQSFPASYLY